jgi:deoxyribodipyrimidine photolyase
MAPQPRPCAVRHLDYRQTILFLSVVLAAAALTSCLRKKTISRDELRSEIRSAYSFAAEAEMFIDYIRQGHATHYYADAHASYLKDAVKQLQRELGEAAPEPGTEKIIPEFRTSMELLCRELSGIATILGDNDALAAARARIENIRKNLEKASSSL